MKPKIPNSRKAYLSLDKRLATYSRKIQGVYDDLARGVSKSALRTKYDGAIPFRISDYPEISKQMRSLQEDFASQMRNVIVTSATAEWGKSNEFQDTTANRALRLYNGEISAADRRTYYNSHDEALSAFLERRDNGLNLSTRIWQQSEDAMRELEGTLSVAIEQGMDAVTLSKRVSQYLEDFPLLQKTYKEKFGEATDIKDCEYRSIRLARSEINMAYRMAEHERWEDMDFILGFEVKTSGSHPAEDICNELAGEYPKDFVFLGWHPNCMCYVVPKVMDEDEYWDYEEKKEENPDIEPEGVVPSVPDGFMAWKLRNEEKIAAAKEKGTLPYFVRDNEKIVNDITLEGVVKILMNRAKAVGDEVQGIAKGVAQSFGGAVTPINYKSYESTLRKAKDMKEVGKTPFDMKDLVRTTIIVDKKNIEGALSELQKQPTFTRLKKQTPDEYVGYSGNIVNLKMSNGLTAEIQVNTAKMIYAKESEASAKRTLGNKRWNDIKRETKMEGGLGHKYYEQLRTLNPGSKEWKKIAAEMREYYSHFNS